MSKVCFINNQGRYLGFRTLKRKNKPIVNKLRKGAGGFEDSNHLQSATEKL